MKKMRVDSKAGILLKENSIVMLKNVVSKSVFMLLTVMIAISGMSFSYDNTVLNSIDTNYNISKKSKKNFPGNQDAIYAEYRKIIHVALPGTKAVLTADREMFAPFVTEFNVVTISMVNLASKRALADLEMDHNFMLGRMHPIANNSDVADNDMIEAFIGGYVAESIVLNKMFNEADEALKATFFKEHFSIGYAGFNSVDALISDSEMGDIFDEENRLKIVFPSASIINSADAEVIRNSNTIQ